MIGNLLLGAVVLSGLAHAVEAQSSVGATSILFGLVRRDSLENPIAGAQVSAPGLRLRATANSQGEFRLNLPAGKQLIEIRQVGFDVLRDSVDLVAGAQAHREFRMTPLVQLDSVRVTERAAAPGSPRLRAFEERRKQGHGHFIGPEELRRQDDREFSQVLRGIAGLRIVSEKSAVWAASSRGLDLFAQREPPTRRTTIDPTNMLMPATKACWVTVFVDGVRIYDRAANPDLPPPDLMRYQTRDYSAVEYYSGGSTLPAEYNVTGGGCGTLLLWTRER